MKIDGKLLFLLAILVGWIGLMILIGPGSDHTLDHRFYYTGAQAREYLTALDETIRVRYLRAAWMDLVLIAIYTTAADRIGGLLGLHDGKGRGLAFVPGFFDFIETTSIIAILSGVQVGGWIDFLGILTFAKWLSGAFLVGFLLVLAYFSKKPAK